MASTANAWHRAVKITSVRSVAVIPLYISYDVIHNITFAQAKVEVIWFDTLVSVHSLALLHVLRIN